MKNKGYTIMEAIVAMFLVVVMVGAVFSALMSGRRAIVSSSEREEVLYSIQGAYGMLKDCRNNNDCYLNALGCEHSYTDGTVDEQGYHDLTECSELFTFGFNNLCKDSNETTSYYRYKVSSETATVNLEFPLITNPTETVANPVLNNFFDLELSTNCSELL